LGTQSLRPFTNRRNPQQQKYKPPATDQTDRYSEKKHTHAARNGTQSIDYSEYTVPKKIRFVLLYDRVDLAFLLFERALLRDSELCDRSSNAEELES
jgi:hypothetical protein